MTAGQPSRTAQPLAGRALGERRIDVRFAGVDIEIEPVTSAVSGTHRAGVSSGRGHDGPRRSSTEVHACTLESVPVVTSHSGFDEVDNLAGPRLDDTDYEQGSRGRPGGYSAGVACVRSELIILIIIARG